MKIVFKFGNNKISYEGKLDDYNGGDNPLKALFSKPNLDFFNNAMFSKFDPNLFNKVYEMAPQNILSFYKDMNYAFVKYFKWSE
jgi:hypothetical protein